MEDLQVLEMWEYGSLGAGLAFLFSLPGLQEMLAILWSPWMALLLASAWNGGAHHSSPWVSAIVVPARFPAPRPVLLPCLTKAYAPVPQARVVEERLRPGEAGDLTCLHPFIDASDGSDLIRWSPDLKGWDKWIQDVEKSLGGVSSMLAQEGWLRITVINEMSFMDPPGNREVVPKILQCDEDSAEL